MTCPLWKNVVSHIVRCFLPKDHRIERDWLIGMWTSQNYLGRDTSSSEEFGLECFENLAMRSFFQNFDKLGCDGSVTHCRMHDVVHDFAQFLTENECVTMEFDNVEKVVLEPLNERARHLTVVSESNISALDFSKLSSINRTNLRTLFAVVTSIGRPNLDYSSLFQHLTCLRSLTLADCGVYHLPDITGRLIYLRYLDLSNNPFSTLPETLSDLCNLRSLNLIKCYGLQGLPEGIGRLVNLRHLYIGGLNEIYRLPKSFGELTCLQSLDALVLGCTNEEACFSVGDFKKLRNVRLRGSLTIKKCRNLQSGFEAEKIGLKSSPQVDHLSLEFAWSTNSLPTDQDGAILEGLEPHQNLRGLNIHDCSGTDSSFRWIASLINLREIELRNCNKCEKLPCLGKLPWLESILLWGLTSVENVGIEFLGITESEHNSGLVLFPKLKKLRFGLMQMWEKWEGIGPSDRNIIMPCLNSLEFGSCPRLRVIPDFIITSTSLQEVEISDTTGITGKEWTRFLNLQTSNSATRTLRKTVYGFSLLRNIEADVY